jgi:Tol biopolymer transport system component/pimeloyl-ACP methyl ester carboxylesterase
MRQLVCAGVLILLPALGVAQEKTVPVPPNTKVEGMPPIPQSIAESLAQYTQYRTALLQAWHPTKRQILFSTTFGATPQLHLIDGPGRDRRQLTWMPGGVSPTLSSPSFDPADGNMLVFAYDPAGGEARSIYRYDFTTGQAVLVAAAHVRYDPLWLRTGKWLVYDSNERNGTDKDLYIIDPRDPKTKRRIAEFTGNWSPHDASPDGKTIVVNELISNSESYLWLVNVQTGEKRTLTPREDEKALWQNARFSSDGKRVYAVTDRHGGDWRVWRCDVSNGAWSPVTPEGVVVPNPLRDGSKFEISSDGSQVAVVADKGSIPGIPPGNFAQIRWRPASRELAFSLNTAKTPNDVYSVDTSLGTVSRWTYSDATFNAESLPAPEIVEWKSFDGLTFSGVVYRPPARFTGPRPVLVNIHGGPGDRETARFLGRSNYFLNELGVTLIYPNVRGSGGFGRRFEQLDNGPRRGDSIKDIGAVLDWIATRPELDRGRVVLTGASYGGWLALEAGIVYNDRIRGIIEGAGIADFITYMEQQDPSRVDSQRAEYGDERDPQMREFLKSISPATRAADLKKPTLILQGGKDPRVPVAQAQELVRALRANNAPVWYVEFTDANHDNFPGTAANYDFLMASWVLFFQQFVLNDAPPASAGR